MRVFASCAECSRENGWDICSRGVIDLARFFLEPGRLHQGRVVITGDDAHHITKVLRLRVGDMIECVDSSGQVHLAKIQSLGGSVQGTLEETVESSQESPLSLTLFQGLAKGDKMDLVVQKAVELGAGEIVPFSSRYTVVKLEKKQAQSRQARWQRIALEAAKQSGRTRIPRVGELHTFKELVARIEKDHARGDLVVLAYEGEKRMGLKDLETSGKTVSAVIGPEGGFAPEEVEELKLAGAEVCKLGPRILRTETAGLVLLSLLGYKWGDLG